MSRKQKSGTDAQTDTPPHLQVQKRHEVRDRERLQAAQEIEHRAREWGRFLGINISKTRVIFSI
jgi:hypothetical protein